MKAPNKFFKKVYLKEMKAFFPGRPHSTLKMKNCYNRDREGSKQTGPAGFLPDHSAPPVPTSTQLFLLRVI